VAALQALAEGPRAADQFAAVSASLLSLVAAAMPSQELLATLLWRLAQALNEARKADDSIASSNCMRLIAYLYVCKAIGTQAVILLLLPG
jgi:hypothetical protein